MTDWAASYEYANEHRNQLQIALTAALAREEKLRAIVRQDYIERCSHESEGGLAMWTCHLCSSTWSDDEEAHAADCILAAEKYADASGCFAADEDAEARALEACDDR